MLDQNIFAEVALRLALNTHLRAQFLTAPQEALATMDLKISDEQLAMVAELVSGSTRASIRPFTDQEIPRLSAS